MREIVGPEIKNIGPIYRGCCYYYTFIKCKRAKSAPGPAPGPASALAWLSLGRPAGSASGRSVRAGARPEAEPGRITGLGHPWPGPARPRPRLGSARPPACEIPLGGFFASRAAIPGAAGRRGPRPFFFVSLGSGFSCALYARALFGSRLVFSLKCEWRWLQWRLVGRSEYLWVFPAHCLQTLSFILAKHQSSRGG